MRRMIAPISAMPKVTVIMFLARSVDDRCAMIVARVTGTCWRAWLCNAVAKTASQGRRQQMTAKVFMRAGIDG